MEFILKVFRKFLSSFESLKRNYEKILFNFKGKIWWSIKNFEEILITIKIKFLTWMKLWRFGQVLSKYCGKFPNIYRVSLLESSILKTLLVSRQDFFFVSRYERRRQEFFEAILGTCRKKCSELFVNFVDVSLRTYQYFEGNFEENLTHQWPYHCLTDRVIFFNQVFDPVCQWPYQGLTDRILFIFFPKTFSTLNVSDHSTVLQTGFKKTQSAGPWYGHWCPGGKCVRKKKPGLTDHGMVTGVC